MSITASGRILDVMRSLIICIDSLDGGEWKGKICNPLFKEPLIFENLISFLKLMEQIFNTFDYPQTSMQLRSFQKDEEEGGKYIELLPLNKYSFKKNNKEVGLATFLIKVMFRQNASWQGTICWLETGKKENFRSVLELIMLMDSTLLDTSKYQQTKNKKIVAV